MNDNHNLKNSSMYETTKVALTEVFKSTNKDKLLKLQTYIKSTSQDKH